MAFPDPRYIAPTPFQYYFVDKDTGAPLAGGIVTFYEQENQTVLKSIYQLDDSTPLGFSVLPNPIILSMVGTIQDDNQNDIIPYLFPFDADGKEQLYFVTVESAGGVLQFTREDFPPNFTQQDNPAGDNELINYVANGQFLLHNNKPTTTTVTTLGTDTVMPIAPGGWSFEKESTSTSTDTVTFIREINPSSNPNTDANPRYYFGLVTNGPDANYQRKDLCLKFPDVNKFAGDPTLTTSFYTFAWQGQSLSGGTLIVDVRLRKFFGTGGSVTTDISLGTVPITPSEGIYNLSFTFGENTGDNVGTTLDDDYLQICLRFPNSALNVELTDFVLTPGQAPVTAFPQTTNAAMLEASTIGYLPTPAYDGSDLYLPVVLTDTGMVADHSVVGNVIAETSLVNYANSVNTVGNLLLADGSQYLFADYSPLGIPYSRLGNFYLRSGGGIVPLYGTGQLFVTAEGGVTDNEIIVFNNRYGSGMPATDGTVATGFSFRSILFETSQANVFINRYSSTGLYCQSNSLSMEDVNTGIVFTSVRTGTGTQQGYVYTMEFGAVNTNVLASRYFTFSANSQTYYCWFKLNGTGTDPAPAGFQFGIQCDIYTGYGTAAVCEIVDYALKGGPAESITTVIGTSMVPNSWFKFTAPNANQYYVWYSLNGNGIDPKPAGFTLGIPVKYTTTMTDAQIASATQLALNSTYFRVPNYQGYFLRGYDPTPNRDFDALTRFGITADIFGNTPGTFEYDVFQSHLHAISNISPSSFQYQRLAGGDNLMAASGSKNTLMTGGTETRPVNAYVVWAIKY